MENKTKADSKTVKEKAKTDLLVCVFGCFAGNGAVHGRQEGEEGRKPLRTSPRLLDFAAARELTRRQLRWRVEQTRRRSSCSSRGALQFLDILGGRPPQTQPQLPFPPLLWFSDPLTVPVSRPHQSRLPFWLLPRPDLTDRPSPSPAVLCCLNAG